MKKSITKMKNHLNNFPMITCVIMTVLLSLASFNIASAQIPSGTVPVIVPAGGFGIDGNTQANFVTPGVGDWIAGSAGTGGIVLNNNGSPIVSSTTFHLIDPFNNTSDSVFVSGSNKVSDDPNTWTWTTEVANPSKTDINNALIHFTTDAQGHVWIVFAADRLGDVGSSYMDFEFMQNTLIQNSNGTFTSNAPAGFGGRTPGDFILSIAFGNSGTEFFLLRWESASGSYKYVTPSITIPAGSVYGAYNTAPVASPYPVFGTNQYPINTFIEAAVDLTKLLGATNPCNNMIVKTIFIKTKSSAGGNSGVSDFIKPLQVNSISLGNANAGVDQQKCQDLPYTEFPLTGAAIPSPGYSVSSTSWSVVSFTGSQAPNIVSPSSLNTNVWVYGGTAILKLTVTTTNGSTNCVVSDDILLTFASKLLVNCDCFDDNDIVDTEPNVGIASVNGVSFFRSDKFCFLNSSVFEADIKIAAGVDI